MPSKSSKSKFISEKRQQQELFSPKVLALIEHKGFKVENKLGQGSYGVVYKAMLIQTGQLAAIKVINLKSISKKSREKYLTREIETLIKSHHPNLINVFDIFRADNKLYIFMEFAENGDISHYRKKHNGIDEKLACRWFWQSNLGLEHLHDTLYTSHRDIKLGNILLDSDWVAKLADFGLAKQCYNPETKSNIMSRTYCGTCSYECPQILQHHPYNGFKADIWSMGVTLFIMVHNKKPFDKNDNKKKMLKQMIKYYPKHLRNMYVKKDLPETAYKLQEDMLNPDEEKRAKVKDILQNEWLKRNAT